MIIIIIILILLWYYIILLIFMHYAVMFILHVIFHVLCWFIFNFSSSFLDSTPTIDERFTIPKFDLLSLWSRFDLKQEFKVDQNTGRVFPHNFHPSVENESMFKYVSFFLHFNKLIKGCFLVVSSNNNTINVVFVCQRKNFH